MTMICNILDVLPRLGDSRVAVNLHALAVLELAAGGKDETLAEKGKRVGITSGGMTGAVDVLERTGLVERVQGEDRRRYDLKVTPAGRELLKKVYEAAGRGARVPRVVSGNAMAAGL